MIKKYFIFLFLFATAKPLLSQPGLHITSSNIGSEIAAMATSFTANSCILSVAPYIRARANGPFAPALPTPIPLGKINLLIKQIGAGINVLNGTTERPLSTSDATLFQAVLGLLTSTGAVNIQYRIPQTEMTNFAWQAGIYTTGLTFTTPGSLLCLGTETFPNTFTLTIDPFISVTPVPDIVLNVNDFEYYRNTSISASHILNSTQTVPLNVQLAAGNNIFQYSNGYAGAPTPAAATGNVSAAIAAPVAYPGIALNTSAQSLTPAGGIAIPVGNKTDNTITYSISPASLKTAFLQKGTYTTTINYHANGGSGANTAGASPPSQSLTVNIADMGEISVNDAVVNLAFNNLADYQNGISVDMPAHLTMSSTHAFDVFVKAAADNLIDGENTIPVSCINIGAGSGQSDVATISLSGSNQKIMAAAAPCLDRSINIKYSVPADKVSQLMGHPAGTYSTTITYSLIAP